MRKELFRKVVVCATLVLFVGIAIIPTVSSVPIKCSATKENQIRNLNTPPVIVNFTWELSGSKSEGWTVTFSVICYDEVSGMDRVEFAINDEVKYIDNTPPSPYQWVLKDPFDIPSWSSSIIKATAYDKAGNSAFATIKASDIHSKSHSHPMSLLLLVNPLFFQILQNLLNLYY